MSKKRQLVKPESDMHAALIEAFERIGGKGHGQIVRCATILGARPQTVGYMLNHAKRATPNWYQRIAEATGFNDDCSNYFIPSARLRPDLQILKPAGS